MLPKQSINFSISKIKKTTLGEIRKMYKMYGKWLMASFSILFCVINENMFKHKQLWWMVPGTLTIFKSDVNSLLCFQFYSLWLI